MKIIVDTCNYFLDNLNLGDIAVYQTVAKRLKYFWPTAEINWITLDSRIIRKLIPEVRPFVLQRHLHWQLHQIEQSFLATQYERVRSLYLRMLKITLLDPRIMEETTNKRHLKILKKMRSVNLVVVIGGGAFSDQFSDHALGLLRTLEDALALGKPSVLMSSGFESISNALLLEMSTSIISELSFISCREPETSPKVLRNYGVAKDKIRVTGDDAVELAYNFRTEELGWALGINIRMAAYSGINDVMVESIKRVLHESGNKYQAPLLGLPISVYGPSDNEGIKKIIADYGGLYDLGEKLRTPEAVIRQAGKCRIVVSGSYHSSVFALAQGIPVVAVASSLHYLTKFKGLAAQFPGGCIIINPAHPGFEQKLFEKINESWENSISLKPILLECAKKQINQGWEAYHYLHRLVG